MIKKLFITVIFSILTTLLFSQENFTCKSLDGSGDITFKYSSKQIIYNFPNFKSKISNFLSLPKDPTYPTSITERFSCVDELNQKWMLCIIEIGDYHSFLLVKEDKSKSITISYETNDNIEKYLSYVSNETYIKSL